MALLQNNVYVNPKTGLAAFQMYVQVPDGSAAQPSLVFTSDPDTGFYSPGTSQVGVSINGTARLVVDASGRLLVNTSTDAGGAFFQVNGDRIRIGTAKTPATAAATGTTGEVCWDASYIYVCTATNTWKRAAITTW